MSLGLPVKSLTVAMRRLEAAAGRGPRHCLYCRSVSRWAPWLMARQGTAEPEELIAVRCEFCRSEYVVSGERMTKDEREVYRLWGSSTLEERHLDPAAHAASLWCSFQVSARGKRKARRLRQAGGAAKITLDPAVRRRADKLLTEGANLELKKRDRLRIKYGGPPFPEHLELVERVRRQAEQESLGRESAEGVEELESERVEHLVCAALEKIIWGAPRPATIAAIERLGREMASRSRDEKERLEAECELFWHEAEAWGEDAECAQ